MSQRRHCPTHRRRVAPDKPQVYREAFRVVKSGGRLAISDVVAFRPLPDQVLNDLKSTPHANPPIEWSEDKNVRWKLASPVGSADRIYITDRDGTTLVMSHAETPIVLAQNQLDDSFSASAAIAGQELFLRGEKNLYFIAIE